MMDLYEAIDILEEYVDYADDRGRAFATPTTEELEAIKVCLEAARDKAGV